MRRGRRLRRWRSALRVRMWPWTRLLSACGVVAVTAEDRLPARTGCREDKRTSQVLVRAVGADRDVVHGPHFKALRDADDRHLVAIFCRHVGEVHDAAV